MLRVGVALVGVMLVSPPPSAVAQATPAEVAVSPQQVRAMLRSDYQQVRAWGAWYAGQFQMASVVPTLVGVIEEQSARTKPTWQDRVVDDLALDALIQLRARVAPHVLLAVYDRRPVQALILLSYLGPEGHATLLEIMAAASDRLWFAAANLLYQQRAPGFAYLVLRKLRLTLSVTIRDPEVGMGLGFGGGSGWGGYFRCASPQLAPGYPPVPAYSFTGGGRGAPILAEGPTTVYYHRVVSPPGYTPATSEADTGGPTARDRLAYFKQSAQPEPQSWLTIVWRDEADAAARIEYFRQDVERRYGHFVSTLLSHGWLTAEEALQLREAPIELQIEDARTTSRHNSRTSQP